MNDDVNLSDLITELRDNDGAMLRRLLRLLQRTKIPMQRISTRRCFSSRSLRFSPQLKYAERTDRI